MKKKINLKVTVSGCRKSEPAVLNEVLKEYLESDDLLADALRNWQADEEAEAENAGGKRFFVDVFPNTELAVDLKLLTRTPGRLPKGAFLGGVITRDDDDHFTFLENTGAKGKTYRRNPHLYLGKYVNVYRKADGTLCPTFTHPRYSQNFRFEDFCLKAAEELLMVAGLGEKK